MKKHSLDSAFRAALKCHEKKFGRGFQAKISELSRISPTQINDALKGRKGLPEEKRRAIVATLSALMNWKWSYDHFLDLGEWILNGNNEEDWDPATTTRSLSPSDEYRLVYVKNWRHGEPPENNLDGIGYSEPDSKIAELTQIPLLGKVPAGIADTLEADDIEKYITLPGAPSNSYALIVSGDSMSPGIRDGDYVLFVIDQEYQHNDIVVVNNEFGDSMIKRLKVKNGKYLLVSDNPEYPTYKPNGEYRIMGKVIDAWRNLKLSKS